ncbi:TPA: glycosyltransferase family 2 protein [Streptococcus suis]
MSEKKQPSVTVLIPVYNGEEHIGDCLDSLMNQSYDNYQILVVNDGSRDKTLEKLQQYPVKILSYEENKGISYALNYGIDHIDTDYIVRMDADDIMHPQRLEIQVKFMEDNPDVFMMGTTCLRYDGKMDWVPEYKRVFLVDELRFLYLFHPVILHPTVIFRATSFKEKGYRYRSDMDGAEDFALFKELVFKETVVNIDYPLMKIRKRPNSASSVGRDRTLDLLERVNRDFLQTHHFYDFSDKIRTLGKILYPVHYQATEEEILSVRELILKMVSHFNLTVQVDRFIQQQIKEVHTK